MTLETLLLVAGAGQLALALASLAVPPVLGWRSELLRVTPLTRQVFWTYGAYVWGAHVSFGLLTLFHAGWLLSGEAPAPAVSGFVATWWGARLAVALLGRERVELPRRASVRAAHAALLCSFGALAGVYAAAALASVS